MKRRYSYERYILPDWVLTMKDYEKYAPNAGNEEPSEQAEPSYEDRAEIRERRENLRQELGYQRRIEQDTTPSIPKVMSQVRGGYARGRTGIRIF